MAGNKEAFQKAMNQGHSAAWDQDWRKAANWYHTALEEFPNHPLGLSSLGLAFFELQDYPAALQCYQKSAVLAPEDPTPQEKIARIYERMGRLNEAISASLQAAEMQLKARSAEKAIENWNRILAIQPENVAVRTRLAAVYERLGRKDEAVNEYISAASVYQRAGDGPHATKLVDYVWKFAPDNQEARLAMSLMRSGQPLPKPSRPLGGTGPMRMAQVREMGEGAPSDSSQPDPIQEARQAAMVQLAALLFDQADETPVPSSTGRGISAVARGVASAPSDASERASIVLHLGQAIDSQSQENLSQAAVELEHAVNLGLRESAAYFDLGLLLYQEAPERALRHLQQAVKHPDFALAAHLLLGQMYLESERWNEAAADFLQALAIADAGAVPAEQAEEMLSQYDALVDACATEDIPALQTICRAVSGQLIRPNWRDYLRKAREQLPPQPEGSFPSPVSEMVLETRSSQVVEAMAQVRHLAARGQLRSALEEAMYGLQYAPTYLPLHVLIAELIAQDGRNNEAVEKFTTVADLYSVRGEIVRAIRILRRVIQLIPMDIGVRQRLIDLLVSQDQIENALQEYVNLADLYYRLTEFDKARQTYLDALTIARKSKDNRVWGMNLLLKVADIDMQRLNLRQALRVFEQIRTIQPDNLQVRTQMINLNFRLGQEEAAMKEIDAFLIFLENGGRRPDAVNFLNDLLVDHANRVDLRRRLADLYLRDNHTAEAITQLDTAADLQLNAGKPLEAINLLETIVSLHPANVTDYQHALEALRRDMLRK